MKKFLASLILITSLSGCGSILNYAIWDKGPRIYGGVYIDITGKGWSNDRIGWVDLPFSFVIDTATFPILLAIEIINEILDD